MDRRVVGSKVVNFRVISVFFPPLFFIIIVCELIQQLQSMELGQSAELDFTLDQPDVDGSKSLFPVQDGWENEEGEPEVFCTATFHNEEHFCTCAHS